MSAAPVTSAEIRDRLAGIRTRLDQMAGVRLSHEFHADGERIVITRPVIDSAGKRAGDEAPVLLCAFGEDATWWEKELLREARDDLSFVLDQLSGAGRMLRELRARLERFVPADSAHPAHPAQRLKNLSAEASMKCGETGFQTWLRLVHGSDDDGDMTDTACAAAVLRRALNIESRKQLNTDPEAAQRWRDMRAEFSAWVNG